MTVVYSAFGSRLSAGVSLLVERSLDAIVNVVFAGDGGRLLVADVAVKTFKFRMAAVHAPTSSAERRSFFRLLGSSRYRLDHPRRGMWTLIGS